MKTLNRTAAIAGLGLGMVLLCLYGGLRHPWISYTECRQDPEKYDGLVVENFREPKIGAIRTNGFELLQHGERPVFVEADTAGLKSGEYVALKAVYHGEGRLTATTVRVVSRRREKMAVSLVPAVMIVFLFFRHFRFNVQRRIIELKPYA
jgi:hypothetical protein